MNNFERIYQTDPSREQKQETESPSIELSDKELLERLRGYRNIFTQTEDYSADIVYKPPIESELPIELKEKFEIVKKLMKNTKTIDIRKKNEKSKSKTAKGTAKKNNSKANKSAVESVQE